MDESRAGPRNAAIALVCALGVYAVYANRDAIREWSAGIGSTPPAHVTARAVDPAARWNPGSDPVIGISAAQAEISSWGRPDSVNRTTTSHGVSEQWVYGSRGYLYFESGRLTAIQERSAR